MSPAVVEAVVVAVGKRRGDGSFIEEHRRLVGGWRGGGGRRGTEFSIFKDVLFHERHPCLIENFLKVKQRGLDSAFILVLWCLWKEGNARFLCQTEMTAAQLMSMIVDEGGLWIQAGAKNLGTVDERDLVIQLAPGTREQVELIEHSSC
ncbi:hypothetical protein BAE44_0000547 [Dichanthelium oligosanthes]|uniref:Uncharacterized protein n=1 Tax=Dichanthelium oligosanthes TaxID=888268 RepID=A0A1E5WM36_9POAL|nr:hypothetical protein BAE44_0000547 [Dichanthelium oligosanthes]